MTLVKDGKQRHSRRRQAPKPNSILDQKAVLQALDERGYQIKQVHLAGLYQALHRQHYPSLDVFVQNYERHERQIALQQQQQQQQQEIGHDDAANNIQLAPVGPLKNAVTNRKNRNKIQLPKQLLDFLKDPDNGFVTLTSRVAQKKTSGDGMTTKLAIELHDGQLVESVIMRYLSHDGSRASLCVSSQCGCAMGCTFCATGTMGLSGNLTAGEILEQMVHADHILAEEWEDRWKENVDANVPVKLDLVRNVVFMGMGEPLDNYSNVVDACRALIDRKRWNLAHGRVTVSTVGLISQIRKLTKELPEVSLALSLHAPNQSLRSAIVPTASRYPIELLIDALDGHMMAYLERRKQIRRDRAPAEENASSTDYTAEERIKESSRRRAMIEYVMLEGETSTFECAHQLGKLCENRHLCVNLIPYNQTNVKDKLKCPSWEHMKQFQHIVTSYRTFCTIRRTMGADIDSACGQLITLENQSGIDESTETKKKDNVADIEDAGKSPLSSAGQVVNKKTVRITEPLKMSAATTDAAGDGMERWILPLAVATSISATCFVAATTLFLLKRR